MIEEDRFICVCVFIYNVLIIRLICLINKLYLCDCGVLACVCLITSYINGMMEPNIECVLYVVIALRYYTH